MARRGPDPGERWALRVQIADRKTNGQNGGRDLTDEVGGRDWKGFYIGNKKQTRSENPML